MANACNKFPSEMVSARQHVEEDKKNGPDEFYKNPPMGESSILRRVIISSASLEDPNTFLMCFFCLLAAV